MKRAKKSTELAKAKRIRAKVARDIKRFQAQNRYEAASVPYLTRSWLYEGIQDARFDMDPYTRLELLRASRYFEKNSWVAERLAGVFCQYTFGPNGLTAIPSSSEESYNEPASHWWRGWSQFPNFENSIPLAVEQSVWGRRWFFDGEVYVYKGYSPDTKRPRIKTIEAHRITNPGTDLADNGNQIIDGHEVDDSTGRTVAYYVGELEQGGMVGAYAGSYMTSGLVAGPYLNPQISKSVNYRRIPADRIIHLFEPSRSGQRRGISRLAAVLRTVHDLHDLQRLEMMAAKDAAETSYWVTNQSGTANTRGMRATRLAIQSQDQAGNTVTKPGAQYSELTQGGAIRYLKIGEDIKQLASGRPSVTMQWYWDYLVRSICAGTGISALLVMPWSLQGTVTRADLDIMNSFFRARSSVAAAIIRELYVWVMGWAVKFDRALDGAPKDWFEVTVRPPRAVNVDVGRNSQAVIAEYEEGFRSLADIVGEMGHDWRHVLEQKAKEWSFMEQLKKRYPGLTDEAIQMMTKEAASSDEEEEEPVSITTK